MSVVYVAGGAGFDVTVTPTVTAGAYSAGDIVGGLMTFAVAAEEGTNVTLREVQVVIKAAVAPNLTICVFTSDPSATTKTDNAAYSLNAADAFKLRWAYNLGSTYIDHGTPNSVNVGQLLVPIKLAAGSINLYVLLTDGTGVTLTSTSDVQVRLAGSMS
jgi:hypothetical protein